jgi:hypothetical protein
MSLAVGALVARAGISIAALGTSSEPMETRMSKKPESLDDERSSPDQQQAGTGKVANDHNKVGKQPPTQTNQGRRTPGSRNDRQSIGPGPQKLSRR